MKVWKFVLHPDAPVEMPRGAEVLSVAEQDEQVCLWALVDPAAPPESRRFVVTGTGHDVPPRGRFIGTVLMRAGRLVVHVWEAP